MIKGRNVEAICLEKASPDVRSSATPQLSSRAAIGIAGGNGNIPGSPADWLTTLIWATYVNQITLIARSARFLNAGTHTIRMKQNTLTSHDVSEVRTVRLDRLTGKAQVEAFNERWDALRVHLKLVASAQVSEDLRLGPGVGGLGSF